MIKALYSRNRTKLGDETFTPNVGVTQGSVISPALFNIYCKDLYEEIRHLGGINEDDVMGYADDLLVLVTSLSQLRSIINIIRSWCDYISLKLNAQKSGVLEFMPRLGKNNYFLEVGTEFEGIPVVNK